MRTHIHLTWLNLYWLLWILAFLGPEFWAISTAPRYTLSDTVWALENINFRNPYDFGAWGPVHWSLAILVWGLFAWLSYHLPFGGLR